MQEPDAIMAAKTLGALKKLERRLPAYIAKLEKPVDRVYANNHSVLLNGTLVEEPFDPDESLTVGDDAELGFSTLHELTDFYLECMRNLKHTIAEQRGLKRRRREELEEDLPANKRRADDLVIVD